MGASQGGYNDPQQLQAVKVFTTSNVGGAYNNGPTLNGVGATYTLTASILIIDGYTLQLFDRVILAGQTDGTQNGVYFYSGNTGTGKIILTRAPDFQSGQQIVSGIFGVITAGNSNDGTIFTVNAPVPFIVGTSTVTFNFIQGSGAGVTYPLSQTLGGTGATSISAGLDTAFGSTQGDILYRDASVWKALAPGAAGAPLIAGGANANPSWGAFGAVIVSAGLVSDANNITGDGTAATMVFNLVRANVGSAYNGSTGVFTVPTTGVYFFSVTAAGKGFASDNNQVEIFSSGLGATLVDLHNINTTTIATNGDFYCNGNMSLPATAGATISFSWSVSGHATKNVGLYGTDGNTNLTIFRMQ